MTADSYGFDTERQRLARERFSVQLRLGILRTAVFAPAIILFLALGGSAALRNLTAGGEPWLSLLLYFTVLYAALWAADLPFSALDHRIERRYALSRQGWRGWAFDGLKGFGMGYGFTLVAVEVLYWLLRSMPAFWWLVAWALVLAVSLVASVIAPVVLVRMYYRLSRLEDPDLEARLRALAERAGVRVLGVFVIRTSSKTARSNAALAGAGRTRRIVLTDTLLATHTRDEVETILAHELAHQRHRDPLIGFVESALASFTSLLVLSLLLPITAALLGLQGIADVAGLPAMVLLGGAIGLVLGPVEALRSRQREARADRTALELTGKPEAFASAMVKLHDANLSLAHPPRLLELLVMTHPAAWRRVATARAFPGRALK